MIAPVFDANRHQNFRLLLNGFGRQTFVLSSTILMLLFAFSFSELMAEEPLDKKVIGPIRADEAFAETYSLDAAVAYLDQASVDWTKSRKCFTCHTNYAYLMARPTISADHDSHQQVRKALEDMVETRWEKQGPRWDAEVVMTAAVLAINDAATTGKLHATTRKALDRMWTVQRDDGGIDWLKCDWPPMESDDEFGACMLAIAVGAAPEEYRESNEAAHGLKKLRDYFAKNRPPTVHHEAMMLWANSYLGDLVTQEERDTTIQKLLQMQSADGGWNSASLGNWERGDGLEQDTESSDGYATGFVIFVLRRSGVASENAQIKKAIAWLKSNQRESGRWYTRSLFQDNHHFLSNAGTAFAIMAIASCENVNQESDAKNDC